MAVIAARKDAFSAVSYSFNSNAALITANGFAAAKKYLCSTSFKGLRLVVDWWLVLCNVVKLSKVTDDLSTMNAAIDFIRKKY